MVAEATPKSISKLMGVEGITLFNIKSHLQVLYILYMFLFNILVHLKNLLSTISLNYFMIFIFFKLQIEIQTWEHWTKAEERGIHTAQL